MSTADLLSLLDPTHNRTPGTVPAEDSVTVIDLPETMPPNATKDDLAKATDLLRREAARLCGHPAPEPVAYTRRANLGVYRAAYDAAVRDLATARAAVAVDRPTVETPSAQSSAARHAAEQAGAVEADWLGVTPAEDAARRERDRLAAEAAARRAAAKATPAARAPRTALSITAPATVALVGRDGATVATGTLDPSGRVTVGGVASTLRAARIRLGVPGSTWRVWRVVGPDGAVGAAVGTLRAEGGAGFARASRAPRGTSLDVLRGRVRAAEVRLVQAQARVAKATLAQAAAWAALEAAERRTAEPAPTAAPPAVASPIPAPPAWLTNGARVVLPADDELGLGEERGAVVGEPDPATGCVTIELDPAHRTGRDDVDGLREIDYTLPGLRLEEPQPKLRRRGWA